MDMDVAVTFLATQTNHSKDVTDCVCANKRGPYNLPERGGVTDSQALI